MDENIEKCLLTVRKMLDEECRNEEYCQIYLKRLMSNDFYILRYAFLKDYDIDATYDDIKNSLLWFKSYRVEERNDSYFPQEFYKIGGLINYETDVDGSPVLYVRAKLHRKIPELEEATKSFLVHQIHKVDQETAKLGKPYSWGLIFDITDAGYENVDIDMLVFISTVLRNHFPRGIKYAIFYNLPWYLRWAKDIAFTLLPNYVTKYVKFCTEVDITEYVDKERLPDFMGGLCRKSYRHVPEGCKSIKEIAIEQYGIKEERFKEVYAMFAKELEDNTEKEEDEEEENDEENDFSEEID